MKRFLLLDGHALFRQGLALLLKWEAQSQALQAGSAEEARRVLSGTHDEIGLAIINIDSFHRGAIELIEELRRDAPDVPVLVLEAGRNLELGTRARRAGADEVFDLSRPIEGLTALVNGYLSCSEQPQPPRDKELVTRFGVRHFVDVNGSGEGFDAAFPQTR